jgi:hypothetical protein
MPITYITERVPLPEITPDIKDVGFTISYNLKTQSFISFHSYLPDMYLNSSDKLITINKNKGNGSTQENIWLHDGHTYQNIYGVWRDWIVEYQANTETLRGQLLEYLDFVCDIKLNDKLTNKIFDKMIIWNENNCTGLLTIEVPRNSTDQYFLTKKVNNSNSPYTVVADRNEGLWNINRLRNYWDGASAMFNEDILSADIQAIYPMDKIFEPTSVYAQTDIAQNWQKISLLYGKTFNIRTIFTNFATERDGGSYKIEMLVNITKTKRDRNG